MVLEGVSVTPRPLFTPRKTRYALYRRLCVCICVFVCVVIYVCFVFVCVCVLVLVCVCLRVRDCVSLCVGGCLTLEVVVRCVSASISICTHLKTKKHKEIRLVMNERKSKF